MLKHLKRIAYRVPDVEAAKHWYANLLHDEPAFDSPVACIFHLGETTLSLAKGVPSPPDDGRLSAYFEVDDVDQAFARLLELGASATSSPQNVLTLRVAQVTDPFGNVIGLCGGIPHDEERTIENQPSETAHAVALCRALLARDDRAELRRDDRFSDLFLREELLPVLADPAERQALIDRRISRPLYGYFAARTAFIDDVFRRALRDRIPQIVFLGAGYDTRALRFAAEPGGVRIFELDAPPTQERKQARLQASGLQAPEHLTFIAVNFKTDDFVGRLTAVGYDEGLATLFVWEGVSYYLSRDTVERTLASLHRHSAPGSAIVFDYMTKGSVSINAGEPFLSFVDPAVLPEWLAGFGFRVADHLDAAAMIRRYLTLANGTVAERPLSTLQLVYAERQPRDTVSQRA
jgi:methyltransferase (TIGR00027 family)